MENLHYKNDKLFILDQRLLPNEEKWIEIKNKEEAYEAIQTLAVRGAPAIGIFAGYSMALFSKKNDIYKFVPVHLQSLLQVYTELRLCGCDCLCRTGNDCNSVRHSDESGRR